MKDKGDRYFKLIFLKYIVVGFLSIFYIIIYLG